MRHTTPLALTAAGLAGVVVARRRAAALGVDNPAPEPAPPRPAPLVGRERTVRTEDGIALHVAEHGPEQAAAVVVLAHGYTQASRLWDGLVRDLRAARPDVRVVVYDHRGHGKSEPSTLETSTLEHLGRDLATVIEQVAGDAPVVLGGHSMGGMTLMALAEQRPDLFEQKVVGVAFLGTSSGGLDAVRWGLPRPVVPLFKKLLPVVNQKAYQAELRGKARQQIAWFEAFVNFTAGADPADVQDVLEVQRECSAATMHFFLATFSDHDRAAALEALSHVPVLVVVGQQDRLCPVEHSRAIAAALPDAELVVFPGAGHMVHLERRPEVGRHLAALVDRALARRPASAAV